MPIKTRSDKGFSIGYVVLLLVVITSLMFIGLMVLKQSKATTNIPANTQAIAKTSTYTNNELRFAFDYPTSWGKPDLTELDEAKQGKVYQIGWEKVTGIVTTTNYLPSRQGNGGAIPPFAFKTCTPVASQDSRTIILSKSETTCVSIMGSNISTGVSAILISQKMFANNKMTPGIAFTHDPVEATGLDEQSLRNAFNDTYLDEYIAFVQSIQEL